MGTSGAMLAVLVLGLASAALGAGRKRTYCDGDEQVKTPCGCCKVGCWYDVSSRAAVRLGHVPGAGGEGEAFATLLAVKACLRSSCKDLCAQPPPN